MEVVAQTPESSWSNVRVSMHSSSRRSFWGNYHWAWHAAWTPASAPRTNVWIETLVYSLQPDELLWAGRSRTVTPNDASALFGDVAQGAAREIERAGLLKGSAR